MAGDTTALKALLKNYDSKSLDAGYRKAVLDAIVAVLDAIIAG